MKTFWLLLSMMGYMEVTTSQTSVKSKQEWAIKDTILTVSIPASRVAELKRESKTIAEYLKAYDVSVIRSKSLNINEAKALNQTNSKSKGNDKQETITVNPENVEDFILESINGKTDNVPSFDLPDPGFTSSEYIKRMLALTESELKRLYDQPTQKQLFDFEKAKGYKTYQKIAFRFYTLSMTLKPR